MTNERVWSRGDKCLALYEEENKYYPGSILKILRSPDLKVIVQFDGYNKDESETVDISKIKPLPKKQKEKPDDDIIIVSEERKDSLFKPLCGAEENSYLENKYRALSDEDSDDYIPITPQRKSITGGQTKTKNRKQNVRKKVVKNKSNFRKGNTSTDKAPHTSSERQADTSPCLQLSQDTFDSQKPSTSKTALHYCHKPVVSDSDDDWLDVSFNTKSHPTKEIVTNRTSTSRHKPNLKRCKGSSTDSTDSDFKSDGFDDCDHEKPKFKFTPCAATVPYRLSGPDDATQVQIPATINRYLRDYQRQGIKFMYDHYSRGQGCILGDDMGLGKTVQVIGFLAALLRKHGNKLDVLKNKPKFIREMSDNQKKLDRENTTVDPFLIIGPGSVLYNWMGELETWGYFTVGKFHGTGKDQCYDELKKGKYDIVVTTYETYRDNQDRLNAVKWTAAIVDEVHKIKGQQAQITQALKGLNTRLRYGLTGTALQNDMIELWCILDWAQPNCLGDAEEFRFNYVEPIKQGQKSDATKRQLAEARKLKEKFSAVRKKMLLRRTKKLIADQLPVKDDNVVYCQLTPFQEAVYNCLHQHPLMKTVMNMDRPCDCGSGFITGRCCNTLKEFKVSFREVMFTFLSLFMKVGNHVALLVPSKSSEDNLKPLTKHIIKSVYDKFPQYFTDSKEASFRTLSDPKYCGKMKVLKGLLSVFYKDHSKVLVFSYSTRVLDIFEQYLMTTEYEYRRIDGSTNVKKRMDLVREFNSDPDIFIFLISTKAGGLGLNLTGANRVVIFDPSWNPTHDLQAQDRAYRIGQRRNVKVYRLISTGTIEENMYLRQIYKQQLDSVAIGNQNANRYFKGIAGDRAHQGELFGVKNMFQFRTGNQCLTLEILNENERVETELAGFTLSKYISTTTESGEDNSERSEEETGEDEVDGNMDSSLLELFGLAERDEFNNSSGNSSKTDSNISVSTTQRKGPKRSPQTNTGVKRKQVSNPTRQSRNQKMESKDWKNRVDRTDATFSSVSDVFDQCGVVHIHENCQVVGGSRAEDHMTRCAIQDVYELHQNSQAPAVHCEPMSDSDDGIAPPPVKQSRARKYIKPDYNTPKSVVIGSDKVLVGQTPKAIRLKHFEEMTRHDNSSTAVDLAEKVLSESVQSRLSFLRDFYSKNKPDFTQLFESMDDTINYTPAVSAENTKSTKKKKTISSRKRIQKENQTLGISFLDIEDSESQKSLERADSARNKTQSLEVGIPPSSRTIRKPPPKKSPEKKQKSGKQKSKHWSTNDTISVLDVDMIEKSQDISDIHHSDDIEDLLYRIGHQEDVVESSQRDGNLNTSILDDIFPSPEKPKRKRAPKQSKKKCQETMSDLDSLPETSVTEDEEGNFADVSTLKDDGIDVFSDPVKWKSRKRHQKEHVSLVDQMVSDAASDYDDLFKSGKMKKVKKLVESPQIKSDSDKSSKYDPSASLF